MTSFRRIGVWQTAFLGDAVLTLPLLQALAGRFPGAQIHFFVREGLQGLFAPQRELAGVRGFAKRGAQQSLAAACALGRELSGQGFDLWISAHTSLRSALVARAVAAPRRIGYASPWFNRLAYTDVVDRAFHRFEEVERIFRLLEPLGVPLPAPAPRLDPDPAALVRAEAFFADLPRPVLGVHPGSTWPTKQWPAASFRAVVARAASAGATVVLFGGPGAEEALAAEIGRDQPGRVVNLAGKLGLPELAAHIRLLDACLTNDSGPMHLAWVQGVPLTALFGPTVRSLGFFPRGPASSVLEADLPCRPCGLHGPRVCPEGHHRCMTDLSPDRVWADLAPKLGL